jgi:CheY-like chemotaxis protein
MAASRRSLARYVEKRMNAMPAVQDRSAQVLVVDDDADIRGVMREFLASEGYSSVGVANGQLALEWLRSSPVLPDLILLDLMMPEVGGLEFLGRIDEERAFRLIPVAIMSAHPSVRRALEDRETRFGPSFLLPKPVDFSRLLTIVAGVVPPSA